MVNVKPVDGSKEIVPNRSPAESAPAVASPSAAGVVGPEAANPGAGSAAARKVVGTHQASASPLALREPVSVRMPMASDPAKVAIEKALAHLESRGVDRADVTAHAIDVDELGMTHVRFNRTYQGVKVFGDQLIVHMRPQAQGVGGDGTFVTGDFKLLPAGLLDDWKYSHDAAEKVAVSLRDQELRGQALAQPADSWKNRVEKVIYRDAQGVVHGGYYVELASLRAPKPQRMAVLIDAQDGKVTDHWLESLGVWLPREVPAGTVRSTKPTTKSRAVSSLAPVPANADDRSFYSGMVAIEDSPVRVGRVTKYKLETPSAQTLDANNDKGKPKDLVDNNRKWNEPADSRRQQAGVDAHYDAQMTLAMYKEMLSIDIPSLFGHRLVSNVHVGEDYANAYWNGKSMNYGDGDGVNLGSLTTLDIGAHEVTHGITEHTAGLIYRDESGGLNEAFSDIGGFLVEKYAAGQNSAVKWNWSVGEQAWTPNNGDPTDALRYMDNPTKDDYSVDHYSRYPQQTEVHGSSGIANNAFYQLAEQDNGSKIPNSVSKIAVRDGIGADKAGKVFFRALRYYLGPSSTFADARAATIRAAIDLYGVESIEVQKTREAWSAVGVEDPAPSRLELGLSIS